MTTAVPFKPGQEEMMFKILAKVYRGSGRPDGFEVVDSSNTERVERLTEGYGYEVVGETDDRNYDPWAELTEVDPDGFTQWKQN